MAETEARVVASEGGVLVRGSGNTLASIAREVGDASLFRLDGKTAVCAAPFTLQGELALGPGEVLRMENPQREWARRFVYLLGRMEFRDCAIEGAYWIDVGPTASGTWRDVRLVSGDNADSGYPLVYFRTSNLDWQGGLIDAHPRPDIFTRRALGTRQGYYPGDVRNTLRGITIRSREQALYDAGDRHEIDLTFEGCDFVTGFPEDRATIESHVTLTDLGLSRFFLVGCRRLAGDVPISFEAPTVLGSAGTVTIEGGRGGPGVRPPETYRAAGLAPARWKGAGPLTRELAQRLRRAKARLERLEVNPRLSGSLFEARRELEYLAQVRAALARSDFYHPRDALAVENSLATVEETLAAAPASLKPGTPYRPRPKPFPAPLPRSVLCPRFGASGSERQRGERARVEALPDGRVRVTTGESRIVYDPNRSGKGYAAITDESRIRDRKLMSAFAPWGGPAPRYLAPSDSARMTWELPWKTRVMQADGPVVGFTSEVSGPRYGARVSFIFFAELPDVILYHAESLQSTSPFVPFRARFAAFSDLKERAYNGMRFWNDDREGFSAYGDAGSERLYLSDPSDGVFVTSKGNRWYRPKLTRGVLAAQWGAANDWRRNPPCGWIVRRGDCEAVYTNQAGYYAHVVELYNPSRVDPEDLSHDLLWFEGAGLGCWENVFALDAAFNDPCRLAPLVLRPEKPIAVDLAEPSGRARPVEIAVLPRAFGGLRTDRPLYRGDCAAMLLRNVHAYERVRLGTLPVRLCSTGPGRATIASDLPAALRAVEVHLPVSGHVRTVRHGDSAIDRWSRLEDEVVYVATVAPGETVVTVE